MTSTTIPTKFLTPKTRGITVPSEGISAAHPLSTKLKHDTTITSLLREAIIRLEKDLAACKDNTYLERIYELHTAKDLIIDLPAFLEGSLEIDSETYRPELVVKPISGREGYVINSPNAFMPNYVEKVGKIISLIKESNLSLNRLDALQLLMEVLSNPRSSEEVEKFEMMAFNLIDSYIFDRQGHSDIKKAIERLDKLLLPLKNLNGERVLNRCVDLFVRLLRHELNRDEVNCDFTLPISFIMQIEKAELSGSESFGVGCLEALKEVLGSDPNNIKEKFFKAVGSYEMSSFHIRIMKNKLRSQLRMGALPKIVVPGFDIRRPAEAMTGLITFGEAVGRIETEESSSEKERKGTSVSSSTTELSIIESVESAKADDLINKIQIKSEVTEPEESTLHEDIDQQRNNPPIEAAITALSPKSFSLDLLSKLLKQPRLSVDLPTLKKILSVISEIDAIDAGVWEKVIEAISKSKAQDLKVKLWSQWLRADKSQVDPRRLTELFMKCSPLIVASGSRSAADYFLHVEFRSMLDKLDSEKDKSKLKKYYEDILKSAMKEGDPQQLLEAHDRYLTQFPSLKSLAVFKTYTLRLVDKTTTLQASKCLPMMKIIASNAQYILDKDVSSEVTEYIDRLSKKADAEDIESWQLLFETIETLAKSSFTDKLKLVDILARAGKNQYCGRQLLILSEELKTTFDNKRIAESVKKQRIDLLLNYIEMVIRDSSGATINFSNDGFIETIEKVYHHYGLPNSTLNNRIFEFFIPLLSFDKEEDLILLTKLWNRTRREDSHALARVMLEKSLEIPLSGLKTEELPQFVDKLTKRAMFFVENLFVPIKKKFINGNVELRIDAILPNLLIGFCLFEYTSSDETLTSDTTQDLSIARKAYFNIGVKILDTPIFKSLLEDRSLLHWVTRWMLTYLFETDSAGRYVFNDILDSNRGSFFNVIQNMYEAADSSYAIEGVLERDPKCEIRIQESLICLIEQRTQEAKQSLFDYCKGYSVEAPLEKVDLEDAVKGIESLVTVTQTIWDKVEARKETTKTAWLAVYETYLDLLIIYTSFKIMLPNKGRSLLERAMENLLQKLFDIVDKTIIKEIRFWNAKNIMASHEDIMEIYDAASLSKEAFNVTLESIESAGKPEKITPERVIRLLLEFIERAFYIIPAAHEKRKLMDKVLDYMYKNTKYHDPSLELTIPLQTIAENDGFETEYIAKYIKEAKNSIHSINAPEKVSFRGNDEATRLAVRSVADYFMEKNTARGAMLLLKVLENSNLEAFCQKEHSLALAVIVSEALGKIRAKLGNPHVFTMLTNNRILNVVENIVFNPISLLANHSSGWKGTQIPEEDNGNPGTALKRGVSILSGTQDSTVNKKFEEFLKSIGRFIVEFYIANEKLHTTGELSDLSVPMATICYFAKVLEKEGVITDEQLINLDDPVQINELDDIAKAGLRMYELAKSPDYKENIRQLVSFIRAPKSSS